MLWMTAFHLCFDLSYLGWWPQNFLRDPFWTLQRTCIVGLFLLCAGLGQAIALTQAQPLRRWWRRWLHIVGAALLVSAGSWWVFPQSFIYFGVLHGMAMMWVLVRVFSGSRWWTHCGGRCLVGFAVLALGLPSLMAALLAGPWAEAAPWFNAPALNWLGWVTHKPRTQDYVPLFPWLGVLCVGLAAGRWLMQHQRPKLAHPLPQRLRWLAVLGRYSLSYYLLHQPVMLGILIAVKRIA